MSTTAATQQIDTLASLINRIQNRAFVQILIAVAVMIHIDLRCIVTAVVPGSRGSPIVGQIEQRFRIVAFLLFLLFVVVVDRWWCVVGAIALRVGGFLVASLGGRIDGMPICGFVDR